MGIRPLDLKRVYKYGHGQSTIIKVFETENKPIIEKHHDDSTLENSLSEIATFGNEDDKPGLVLLIAQRIYRNRTRVVSSSDSNDAVERGGQQLTRVLPFSQAVFENVSKSFYVHGSISPAVSRADIPFFSYDEALMKDSKGIDQKAWVYNCRSSNAWGKDLAMTVTHFPHRRISFGVIFGCADSQQEYVIRQVSAATKESAHPLFLPGIFAEIERKRHHGILDSAILDLESVMPDEEIGTMLTLPREQIDALERRKRTAYLEVLHLKHGLESWRTQLFKMIKHAKTLTRFYAHDDHTFDHSSTPANEISLNTQLPTIQPSGDPSPRQKDVKPCFCQKKVETDPDVATGVKSHTLRDNGVGNRLLLTTTNKITRRLHAIIDEYGDKIGECQIRFDSITIATQLFQGETNLQLTLATNKDSRHMKTIALVTMTFLPGTFFATVFSMTFFNWQGTDGESTVSSFIWIYVVFSVLFTALTLLAWYYFGSTNPKTFGLSRFRKVDNTV
ncbi:hypothetical protein F5Y10DRAFT_260148 [Nemania abortiva]|nr:hypothetical protein F5Y10DRAFT_260148 [Nemania abortiva]